MPDSSERLDHEQELGHRDADGDRHRTASEERYALLDRIRRKNVGEYGPFLSAVERQAMMTISTGVQAVAEGKYGRTDEAMWYVDKIVQTFNRRSPGSISEMMPDYGCFTIAWTSYGIVLPLIQHVFGIQPDAMKKTVVFDPHLPTGWEDIAIEDLPVGTNEGFVLTCTHRQGDRVRFRGQRRRMEFHPEREGCARRPILLEWQARFRRLLRHPHERAEESRVGGSMREAGRRETGSG